MAQHDLASHAATLSCPCGRTVSSSFLDAADLRALTGFRSLEGLDLCGECAARVRKQRLQEE